MITDLTSLRAAARTRGAQLTLAVVGADHEATLQAVLRARAEGLAESILIGPTARMCTLWEGLGGDLAEARMVDAEDENAAAEHAAHLASRGEANVVLKGRASSPAVLRAVLQERHGLRVGAVLSDVRLYDNPLRPGHLLAMTDGGVIPQPSLQQKRGIIENAVTVFHRLGIPRPRVAVLAASEKIMPAVPHTAEARALAEMARSGVISGCAVDGPLSLDLAVSEAAAAQKGLSSEVTGRAEILVGPNIETINVLAKSLVYFAGCIPGQVVMGARVPVLIPSRADGPEVKLNSIALAALMA